ncbi:MAG: 8-amino-7-oxononanoate synthase [Candidatus Hydrogenedentota bacterium]
MSNHESIQEELAQLDELGLTRRLRTLQSSGGFVEWKGRNYMNLSSNDYLNLANDYRVKEGAIEAIEKFGCGATASRLMAGHFSIHEQLEEALSDWLGMDSCLVFPSGFQANLGMVTSLVNAEGAVFSDALNHASIVDGCRLSGAPIHIYDHADADHLETLLQSVTVTGRKLIVSDSVFSMDGDHAPLKRLTELARKYDCLLAIDEAHAIGIFGDGHGLCYQLNVRPDIIVGTLTKSFGSGGGFICSPDDFRSLFINRARSFIFSTGLSPACVGSALAALEVMRLNTDMGAELLVRSKSFRASLESEGVSVPDQDSQIIPIMIGENADAVHCMDELLKDYVLLAAVRPPSVPHGTARLRISLTRAHGEDDLANAAKLIAQVVQPSKV